MVRTGSFRISRARSSSRAKGRHLHLSDLRGFGRRVHRHGDSRVPIMREATDRVVGRTAAPDAARPATLHAALGHTVRG